VRGQGVGGRGAGDSPRSAARRADHGLTAGVLDNRQPIPTAAFQQHPVPFVREPPRLAPLPEAVWIGLPKPGPPEGGGTHWFMRAGVSKSLTSSLRPNICIAVDGRGTPLGLLEHVSASSQVHLVIAISGGGGRAGFADFRSTWTARHESQRPEGCLDPMVSRSRVRLGLSAYLEVTPEAGRAFLNFVTRNMISFKATHSSLGRLMVYSQPRKNLTTRPTASRQGLLCGFGL